MKTVLILGSAPDAVRAKFFDLHRVNALVALNNAWQIRADWTHAIYPEDFPAERHPVASAEQQIITYRDYVPANNAFGGIIYAGATMAFTAGYWALAHFKPDIMLFCGTDMMYNQPSGSSHFYGDGEADPLRDDPTLQSLEGKSNRLMLLAARAGCLTANLSDLPASRLTFPRFDALALDEICQEDQRKKLLRINAATDQSCFDQALAAENDANLTWEAGDYWQADFQIDHTKLKQVDALWENAISNHSEEVIS